MPPLSPSSILCQNRQIQGCHPFFFSSFRAPQIVPHIRSRSFITTSSCKLLSTNEATPSKSSLNTGSQGQAAKSLNDQRKPTPDVKGTFPRSSVRSASKFKGIPSGPIRKPLCRGPMDQFDWNQYKLYYYAMDFSQHITQERRQYYVDGLKKFRHRVADQNVWRVAGALLTLSSVGVGYNLLTKWGYFKQGRKTKESTLAEHLEPAVDRTEQEDETASDTNPTPPQDVDDQEAQQEGEDHNVAKEDQEGTRATEEGEGDSDADSVAPITEDAVEKEASEEEVSIPEAPQEDASDDDLFEGTGGSEEAEKPTREDEIKVEDKKKIVGPVEESAGAMESGAERGETDKDDGDGSGGSANIDREVVMGQGRSELAAEEEDDFEEMKRQMIERLRQERFQHEEENVSENGNTSETEVVKKRQSLDKLSTDGKSAYWASGRPEISEEGRQAGKGTSSSDAPVYEGGKTAEQMLLKKRLEGRTPPQDKKGSADHEVQHRTYDPVSQLTAAASSEKKTRKSHSEGLAQKGESKHADEAEQSIDTQDIKEG